MKLDRADVQTVLQRARDELVAQKRDYELSVSLEDCMAAVDLGNARMDKFMLTVGDAPLYEYCEPAVDLNDPAVLAGTLSYLVRGVTTWQTGRRSILDTLIPLQAVRRYLRPHSAADEDCGPAVGDWGDNVARCAVLAAWRCIDLTVDLVAMCGQVVKAGDDFIVNLHGLLPLQAGRSRNGHIIADLQELERALSANTSGFVSHLLWPVRFLKLWMMWLTTWSMRAPMTEHLQRELERCLVELELISQSDDDIPAAAVGFEPVLCNLHFVGCPRMHFEPVLTLAESVTLVRSTVVDVARTLHVVASEADLSLECFRFSTTLGRVVCGHHFVSKGLLFRSLPLLNGSACSAELWRLRLAHPSRQWRLLKKRTDLSVAEAKYWLKLAHELSLLEAHEAIEAEAWLAALADARLAVYVQRPFDCSIDEPTNMRRFRYRWAPLIASFPSIIVLDSQI